MEAKFAHFSALSSPLGLFILAASRPLSSFHCSPVEEARLLPLTPPKMRLAPGFLLNSAVIDTQ